MLWLQMSLPSPDEYKFILKVSNYEDNLSEPIYSSRKLCELDKKILKIRNTSQNYKDNNLAIATDKCV